MVEFTDDELDVLSNPNNGTLSCFSGPDRALFVKAASDGVLTVYKCDGMWTVLAPGSQVYEVGIYRINMEAYKKQLVPESRKRADARIAKFRNEFLLPAVKSDLITAAWANVLFMDVCDRIYTCEGSPFRELAGYIIKRPDEVSDITRYPIPGQQTYGTYYYKE